MEAMRNLVIGSAKPQYLTGDKSSIDAFIDKFDVSVCVMSCSLAPYG
jgi:hypothetical protein